MQVRIGLKRPFLSTAKSLRCSLWFVLFYLMTIGGSYAQPRFLQLSFSLTKNEIVGRFARSDIPLLDNWTVSQKLRGIVNSYVGSSKIRPTYIYECLEYEGLPDFDPLVVGVMICFNKRGVLSLISIAYGSTSFVELIKKVSQENDFDIQYEAFNIVKFIPRGNLSRDILFAELHMVYVQWSNLIGSLVIARRSEK